MIFGEPQPWALCLICDAALFPPARGGALRCHRCGEDYETREKPTGKAPASYGELLEFVFRAPHDDEPRRMLADLLLEQGDSRGELIQLQLDDSAADEGRRRRIAELLVRDGWRWVPPGVVARESTFERGFLARANFPSITDPQHVGWRTVTRVDVGPMQVAPTQRSHSPLAGPLQHSLEHLGRCRLDFLAWLREQSLPKLRTLGVVVSPDEWTRFLPDALLTAVVAWPSLEELDVASASSVRSRWADWTSEFIAALHGKVKTLWLPMPAEVPESLRRRGLAKLAPDLTLKLATPDRRDDTRTVISLSREGVGGVGT